MKYFIILLYRGKVVEVCSYDDQQSQLEHLNNFQNQLATTWGLSYDELQTLAQVI
jgi:hypothetical protein